MDPITFNPAHGIWINDLIDRGAECAWLTAWEESANAIWPELLGIPELPMAASHEQGDLSKMSMTAEEWKFYSIAERHAGRPIVWIDDWNAPFDEERFAGRGRPAWIGEDEPWGTADALVITTDARFGLTREQMDRVDAWLEPFLDH